MVCWSSCVTYRQAWSVGLHVRHTGRHGLLVFMCDIQAGMVCRPSCGDIKEGMVCRPSYEAYRKAWSVGLHVRHTGRHGQ